MGTQEPQFHAQLRVMQIIAGALIAGVVIFLAIVLFLVEQRGGQPQAGPNGNALPVITLVSVVFLLSVGAAALAVPRGILNGAVSRLAKAPRDGFDTIIAAVAEANGCVVVTGNEKVFAGVQVLNPLKP